jgi:hypothetical protein
VLVPWRRVAVGSGAEVGRVRVLVCEADARGLRVASYGLEGGVEVRVWMLLLLLLMLMRWRRRRRWVGRLLLLLLLLRCEVALRMLLRLVLWRIRRVRLRRVVVRPSGELAL